MFYISAICFITCALLATNDKVRRKVNEVGNNMINKLRHE